MKSFTLFQTLCPGQSPVVCRGSLAQSHGARVPMLSSVQLNVCKLSRHVRVSCQSDRTFAGNSIFTTLNIIGPGRFYNRQFRGNHLSGDVNNKFENVFTRLILHACDRTHLFK